MSKLLYQISLEKLLDFKLLDKFMQHLHIFCKRILKDTAKRKKSYIFEIRKRE